MSGASSEGPDSPEPKLAAVLERLGIVHIEDNDGDERGVVRPGAGVRLERKSGELTPTRGGAGAHIAMAV